MMVMMMMIIIIIISIYLSSNTETVIFGHQLLGG